MTYRLLKKTDANGYLIDFCKGELNNHRNIDSTFARCDIGAVFHLAVLSVAKSMKD